MVDVNNRYRVGGTVHGAVLCGVEAVRVEVEVDLLRRLPCVVIVGLPSPSVRESAERVRSAIQGAGLEFPRSRVVISMAPADLRKEGTGFDLPVAIGILAAHGIIRAEAASRWLLAGELALSGLLRPVRGALAMACLAREHQMAGIIVPEENGAEAALVPGLQVRVARTLLDVVQHLNGEVELPTPADEERLPEAPPLDLRDVRDQPIARFALEVAAAGGHNLLMEGPPGCGKTMLAARLPGILPPLSQEEALECTRIHSVAGLRTEGQGIIASRPFRAPHHSVSTAGLLGGADLRPGEASLAHHGVLFLDEFPEFRRDIREGLRGPLEDRRIVLTRASGTVTFPAGFSLVAAANRCLCGYFGHPRQACRCSPPERQRYRNRLSGPILDRIDCRLLLSPVGAEVQFDGGEGEGSAAVRARVVAARARQYARNGPGVNNAALPADQLAGRVLASPAALSALVDHVDRTGTSARAAKRVLRVARTIADIEGAVAVEPEHLGAALQLRVDALAEEAP